MPGILPALLSAFYFHPCVLCTSEHDATDCGTCCIGGPVPLLRFDVAKGEMEALSGQTSAPPVQNSIDWYVEAGDSDTEFSTAPVPSSTSLLSAQGCDTLTKPH